MSQMTSSPPIAIASGYLRRGFLWLLAGLGLAASFILITLLIQSLLVVELILPWLPPTKFTPDEFPPAPPTLARHALPNPINIMNQRILYPDRPDFWGWQPPWFQTIPVEGGMAGLLGQSTREMKRASFSVLPIINFDGNKRLEIDNLLSLE